jgi:hypothetical protein
MKDEEGKMKIVIEISLVAVPITSKYEEVKIGERYPIKKLMMGQSSTTITLENIRGAFSSVHFKFYIGQKEVDIFNSALLNPYRLYSKNPAIMFKEKEVQNEQNI